MMSFPMRVFAPACAAAITHGPVMSMVLGRRALPRQHEGGNDEEQQRSRQRVAAQCQSTRVDARAVGAQVEEAATATGLRSHPQRKTGRRAAPN